MIWRHYRGESVIPQKSGQLTVCIIAYSQNLMTSCAEPPYERHARQIGAAGQTCVMEYKEYFHHRQFPEWKT